MEEQVLTHVIMASGKQYVGVLVGAILEDAITCQREYDIEESHMRNWVTLKNSGELSTINLGNAQYSTQDIPARLISYLDLCHLTMVKAKALALASVENDHFNRIMR